uniref:GATA-type domain-containing protein n=1 Tax=Kalanchoe fedtschenkoi TaxID=63787 RepID=A0A7N0TU57_KALFE
ESEEEEELEWLSNKDVFPSVETFVDVIPVEPSTAVLKHVSPVSVLENSISSFGSNSSNDSNAVITTCCIGRGLTPPIRRPRSRGSQKRRRGGFVDISSQQWFIYCSSIHANKTGNNAAKALGTASGITSRKCKHCGSEKTPQWRAGPDGPKTLCNACGVRYKSGRLCPEYRPASSPTFSSAVHSNSHRKIVEMKKMKQHDGQPCG